MLTLLASSALARQWTEASGQRHFEAELVEQVGDKVRLKTATGKIVEIPLGRLSAADQEYVRTQGKRGRGADATSGPPVVKSADSAAPSEALKTPSAPAPLSIGVKTFAELERLAGKQQAINAVIQLYKLFLSDPQVSEAEKKSARDRMLYWEDLAKGQAVRIGSKWVTGAQFAQMQQDEVRLVEEALRLLELGNLDLAEDRFRRASKANPKGIRGDYVLGLLDALIKRDSGEAEDHFSECVKRRSANIDNLSNDERADLLGALNNLALAEVRQRKYDSAIKHWKAAAKVAPPPAQMVQNVGRLVHLAKASPMLGVPPQAAKSAGDLYAEVAVRTKAARFDEHRGWLYMELFSGLLPEKPEPRSAAPSQSTPSQQTPSRPTASQQPQTPGENTSQGFVLVGFGSGFLFHPHCVATNQHVVEGADRITVVFPGKEEEIEADVLAVSAEHDLAIIRSAGIDGIPVPISDKPARLGSDMLLLGYPVPTLLGLDLKATRGSITGLPSPEIENMLLYDAVSNPGNSGGPVSDKTGAIIAVHRAGLLGRSDKSLSKLAGGVPVSYLLDLAKANVPDLQLTPPGPAQDDWADVVDAVGRSTCLVVIYKQQGRRIPRYQPQPTAKPEEKDTWTSLQDPWCMLCNGTGVAECPVRACARGLVPSQRVNVVGSNPVTGQRIMESVPTRVTCTTCRGRGKVDCTACTNGIDRDVRVRRSGY